MEEYTSTFRVALGASAYFVGRLPKTRLQLHDSLTAMVEGSRITDRAADHISIVLGMDVFDPKKSFYANNV